MRLFYSTNRFSLPEPKTILKKCRSYFFLLLNPASYFIILFILNILPAPHTPEAKFLVPAWAIKSTLAQG
jgi:hypothetical protein